MRRNLIITLIYFASLSAFSASCTSSKDGKIEDSMLEAVPANATLVVLIDLEQLAKEAQVMTPFDGFDDRWAEMGEDFNRVLEHQLGLGLMESEQVVIWQEGEDGCAVIWGDFDDELRGEGVTNREDYQIREIEDDQMLAIYDGTALIGTEGGVRRTIEVLDGEEESLEDADSDEAEVLTDLLEELGGTGNFAVAVRGEMIPTQALEGLVPPATGAALLSRSDELIARLRLNSADDAEALESQLKMLIAGARAEFASRRAEAHEEDIEDAFEILMTYHFADLMAEEMLDLGTDGEDFVISLKLGGSLGSSTAFLGVAAAVAIPAFLKYINRAKAAEAEENIMRIFESAAAYYDTDHAAPNGMILPPQFPDPAPLTPFDVPCGERAEANIGIWQHPTWEALNFALGEAHYYSYQFDSYGVGPNAEFQVSAFGDLDCDGFHSTFTRAGGVTAQGEVRSLRGTERTFETE